MSSAKPRLALLACLLISLSLPLAACGKSKKTAQDDDEKKKEKPMVLGNVALGGGSTTVYKSIDPKAPIIFTVNWSTGVLDASKGGISAGQLTQPYGDLYRDGKPVADYRADSGDAVQKTQRLNLRNHVLLKSKDGKHTLSGKTGEYRGDLGLVRLKDDVVATAPFGTLSGVPELWATPDLHLIGTPDMVSPKLKTPAVLALAATAAVASARLQNGRDFTFENARSLGAENLKAGGYRLTAKPAPGGQLVLNMPSRGIVVHSSSTIVVTTDSTGKVVRELTTDGTVNFVRTTTGGTTTLNGTGAQYTAAPNAVSGDVTIGGRVTITDVQKGQTTVCKGDKGSAVLLTNAPAGASGLKSATLTGNVTIDSTGSSKGTFNGSGDRLHYVPSVGNADVDLDGNTMLKSVTRGEGGSNTVVAHGAKAHGLLDLSPVASQSPLRSAVLTNNVTLDVTGSNGQTFKGKGDKVVYTAEGTGGKAVMTGDLTFSGDAPEFLGDIKGADTAEVIIDGDGWKEVNLLRSDGGTTETTYKTKPPVKKGGGR